MSTPELVMFAVVLAVGFPAAWRNLTAAALVASYLVMQGAWALGIVLDYGTMFCADIAVVALVYAKASVRCPEAAFDSSWHQLRCMVTYLTPSDRAILGLFVFGAWPAYVLTMSDFARWWALYLVALVQLLFAAAESYIEWRRARALRSDPGAPSSGSLREAWAGGRAWST